MFRGSIRRVGSRYVFFKPRDQDSAFFHGLNFAGERVRNGTMARAQGRLWLPAKTILAVHIAGGGGMEHHSCNEGLIGLWLGSGDHGVKRRSTFGRHVPGARAVCSNERCARGGAETSSGLRAGCQSLKSSEYVIWVQAGQNLVCVTT